MDTLRAVLRRVGDATFRVDRTLPRAEELRARLTPKPWRCGCPPPPCEDPRLDPGIRRRFDAWLADYERASAAHATCRCLQTVGPASRRGAAAGLIELHDRLTRCRQALPLA